MHGAQPIRSLSIALLLVACLGGPSLAAAAPQPQPFPQPAPQPQPGGMKQLNDANGVYSIQVPADWQSQQQQGTLIAALPNSQITMMIMAGPKQVQTIEQFAELMVASWKQRAPQWTEVGREPVTVSGCRGLHIRATTKPEGMDMVGEYFLVLAERHQLVMLLGSRAQEAQQASPIFQAIVASWRIPGAQAQPQPQPQPWPQPQLQPQPQPQPQPAPGGTKQVADPGGAFAFAVPADWQAQQQAGSAVAMDPTQRVSVMAVAAAKQVQTLEQFAQGMTAVWKQQVAGWTQVGQEAVQVSGRPALHIRATGTPGGQAMAADYILVLTEARQALLMLSCPQQELEQRQAVFQQIMQSFQAR